MNVLSVSLPVVVDFKVDTGKPLSNGAVAGIVIAACAIFGLLVLVILRLTGYLGGKEVDENGNKENIILFKKCSCHFQDLIVFFSNLTFWFYQKSFGDLICRQDRSH